MTLQAKDAAATEVTDTLQQLEIQGAPAIPVDGNHQNETRDNDDEDDEDEEDKQEGGDAVNGGTF
jgi:hypothetical protein